MSIFNRHKSFPLQEGCFRFGDLMEGSLFRLLGSPGPYGIGSYFQKVVGKHNSFTDSEWVLDMNDETNPVDLGTPCWIGPDAICEFVEPSWIEIRIDF